MKSVDVLYQKENLKNQRINSIKRMKEKKESEICTFKPNLSKTERFNRSFRKNRKVITETELVDRLYEVQTEKFQMLDKIKEMENRRKEEEEINNCTFAPKINDYSPR